MSSTSHADPSRGAPSSTDPMGPAAGVSEGNAADGRQRYVFEVHDVDNMGGTPSRLSISNANTGELVRSFDLPAGDSRITADLPPGEYTIEVQAGSRPEGAAPGNPDRFDNFSVNMFSAGATPAGGGDGASLGGGGSGGGGGGGSGP